MLADVVKAFERRIDADRDNVPTPATWRDEGAYIALRAVLDGTPETDAFMAEFDRSCERFGGAR